MTVRRQSGCLLFSNWFPQTPKYSVALSWQKGMLISYGQSICRRSKVLDRKVIRGLCRRRDTAPPMRFQ
jgi:hypothetical protein